MATLDELTLKNQLKENKFFTSYLIWGDEPYLKQHYVKLIAKKAVTDGMEGFNLRNFDAENGNGIQELIDATDTLPMFSEHSCTVIKDFALDEMYSADKEKFEGWLAEMPETTVAVFWQDTTEINPKKQSKWKSVIELFNKYGAVVCLDKMDENALVKTVTGGLNKRGTQIDRPTAFYLVDCVGDDLNLLLNEVEKLADYKKGGTVTREDIDAVCIKSLEASIFDLSKALLSGNLARAMAILSKLLADKEKPEVIFGALSSNFIDMYRVKVSVLGGKDAEYLKDAYNYRNTAFRLRNARRDAQRLSLDEIKRCLELLEQADMKIKLRTTDERIILEKLLCELFKTVG